VADRELAIAPVQQRDPADLRLQFVAPLEHLKQQVLELEAFKKSIMIVGVDYGVIPGTDRPTLLKPGAEKLALAFGLVPQFSVSNKIEDWTAGFFFYEINCELISKRTGDIVANGIGSANSKEPRYRWRNEQPVCPQCGAQLRRSKRTVASGDDPGWYCWARMGGCGAEFPKSAIRVGRVENSEPYELVNTLGKMAQKRALVAAVLIATGGSSIWTQDVEDFSESEPPEDDEVIDVPLRERDVEDAPRPAPPKRGPGRPPKPKPTEEVISSADDKLWRRWLDIRGEALSLGVKGVDELRLPLTKAALVNAGLVLSAKISQRRAQLQSEEAGRAAGARARVMGTSDEEGSGSTPPSDEPAFEEAPQAGHHVEGSPAWERNRALVGEANALGMRPLTLRNTATPAEIARANQELEAQIERWRQVAQRANIRRGAG
jgi:hypothetical protein